MEECNSMSMHMNQNEKLMKDDNTDRVQEGYYRRLNRMFEVS